MPRTDIGLMAENTNVDVVFITALPKERDALLKYLQAATELHGYRHAYVRASLDLDDGSNYSVVVVTLPSMGNVQASAATTRAINVWNPAQILLVGITGGLKKGLER